MDLMREVTIAEAAQRTGLTAHTLRCYERIGLLDPVDRVAGGQRRFTEPDLEWLRFLQRLRATGMSILDRQAYADLRRRGESTVTKRRELLERHAARCCTASRSCRPTCTPHGQDHALREPQLDVHLHAARNVGLSVAELEKVMIHVAPYAGFPAAINGMRRLQALEAER